MIFASVNFRNAWETVGEVDETVDLNLPNSVSVSPDDSSLLLALKFWNFSASDVGVLPSFGLEVLDELDVVDGSCFPSPSVSLT